MPVVTVTAGHPVCPRVLPARSQQLWRSISSLTDQALPCCAIDFCSKQPLSGPSRFTCACVSVYELKGWSILYTFKFSCVFLNSHFIIVWKTVASPVASCIPEQLAVHLITYEEVNGSELHRLFSLHVNIMKF